MPFFFHLVAGQLNQQPLIRKGNKTAREVREQWNYQIAVDAIEIQALNGDDVIGGEIDRSVYGGAGAVTYFF